MATVFRPPLVTRIPPRQVQQPMDPPNLLTTTLNGKDKFFGAAGQPPANMDWPVPRGANPGPVSNRTHLDGFRTKLFGQDTMFGGAGRPLAQTDWPVPKGPNPGPVDNRTHIDGFRVKLWGLDTMYAGAGFPINRNYDWPVPRGPQPGVVTNRTLESNNNWLPLRFIPSPFFQTDWPVPRGPVHPIALRTWTEGYKIHLFKETIPFLQMDWPVPKGPNPGSVANRTHAEGYKVLLFKETIPPGRNLDWPVPMGARNDVARILVSVDLLTTTLVPAASSSGYDFWHYYSP